MTKTRYNTVKVAGLEIFYREAGPLAAPVVLLLHGFPSASHMFRDLLPLLSGRFRVIAPDLPGFGRSSLPSLNGFDYTFETVANTMTAFTEALEIELFALYVFDYGAPVGFRMAMQHPERIKAIISQNGNTYEEGLSSGWDSMKEYWRSPTREFRESLRTAFTASATEYQYITGTAQSENVGPDGQNLDNYYLARPGAHDAQLAYFLDYGNNVALYPAIQGYLRANQPPILAVWGENDPYFLSAGAHAFKRDVPKTEVVLLPTGHFALETHADKISALVLDFLDRNTVQV